MWQVIIYTVAVSLALSLMGFADEKLAIMRDLPRRFLWVLVMVMSISWPLGMMLWMQPARAPASLVHGIAMTAPQVVPEAAPIVTDTALLPSLAQEKRQSMATQPNRQWQLPLPSSRTLVLAWAATSGVLLAWLCALDLLLHRRSRHWRRETFLGRQVLVSEHTGPALLGALRPRIVVPRWFLDEPPATQSLILEHEHQHLRARDPLLLRVALLLAVLVPWNLPLWWQLQRLRRAIELDCDARVLRSGAEAGPYGAVLLAVTRRAVKVPVGVVAMSEPASALEQRIANLVPDPARHSVLRATAALLVWCAGIGIAGSFEPPAMPGVAAQGTANPAMAAAATSPPLPAAPVAPIAPRAVVTAAAAVPPAAPVAGLPPVSAATPAAAMKATAAPAPAVPAAPAVALSKNQVDLGSLISQSAERFKKRFVVDPRVRGTVDAGALDPDSLTYHAFLEVLGVHGFIAVPSGDVVAILPDAYLAQVASPVVRVDDIRGDDAEIVTVIIPVGDIRTAQQLAVSLRQLVPKPGFLNTTADEKSLLLVDKVANAKRIIALVRAQVPPP